MLDITFNSLGGGADRYVAPLASSVPARTEFVTKLHNDEVEIMAGIAQYGAIT